MFFTLKILSLLSSKFKIPSIKRVPIFGGSMSSVRFMLYVIFTSSPSSGTCSLGQTFGSDHLDALLERYPASGKLGQVSTHIVPL